jgi:hypothetical protein
MKENEEIWNSKGDMKHVGSSSCKAMKEKSKRLLICHPS